MKKVAPHDSDAGRKRPGRASIPRFGAGREEHCAPPVHDEEKAPHRVWRKRNAIRFLGLILALLVLISLKEFYCCEDFFEVTLYIHEEGMPGKYIESPGQATLMLDAPISAMFENGNFIVSDIPSENIGKIIHFQIEAEGYDFGEGFQSKLERSKIIYIPVRKNREVIARGGKERAESTEPR